MNDFISANLKKLKDNKIPNPEIDLRVLLNNSRCCKNEIVFSNFNIDQIDINKFNFSWGLDTKVDYYVEYGHGFMVIVSDIVYDSILLMH